jgi:D-lactate dehydrogenase (cytochrome)
MLGDAIRRNHAGSEGFHPAASPDAVFSPTSIEEVSRAVTICAAHGLPVIPFGAGSSLEGQLTAVLGGLSLDLAALDQVLEVNAEDMDALVQPGVTRKALNAHLRDQGLFFPVDPGADATLGGMAATRATGTTTVYYGGMRENVMGLTVVLPSGELVRTGTRARKSSAGYDLTRLMVGSEGTLGVIVELRVRLHPLPQAIVAAVCPFPSLEAAATAVIEAAQSGLAPARIELLDALSIHAVNAHAGSDHAETPTLFLEFYGSERDVADQAALMLQIAEANGGGPFVHATTPEARTRLWEARHRAYFAGLALAPGKVAVTTDVCVPVSRLAECIVETRDDIDAHGMLAPILGHVGDGNFHTMLLVDPTDGAEVAKARALAARMIARAQALGGTCTGEHGIGLGKKSYLANEAGESGISMMRAIKRALDPKNIMNPGKIFDPARESNFG